MKMIWQACLTTVLSLAVSGCATGLPKPTSTITVNRFYRDMSQCFERSNTGALKERTFTRYNPKAVRNLMRETVTYTANPKTDREYRVVFAETAPDTTSIRSYSIGRSGSQAQVQDAVWPTINTCADRPF